MTKVMRTAAVLFAAGGLQAAGCHSTGGHRGGCGDGGCNDGGCGTAAVERGSLQDRYNACVDPCWPERYSVQARALTLAPFATQAANGQALDQTLFNGDFDAGTDRIHPGGLQKLDTIARRRPVDGKVYVQTSRDVAFDPAKAGEFAKAKADLDSKRAAAVRAYLEASTSGRNLDFQVAVTDPADTAMLVTGFANATRGYPTRFTSGIGAAQSSGQVTAGGSSNIFNLPVGANQAPGSQAQFLPPGAAQGAAPGGAPGTGAPGAGMGAGGTGGPR